MSDEHEFLKVDGLPVGIYPVEIKRKQYLIKRIFDEVLQGDGYIAGGFARFVCSTQQFPAEYADIDLWTDTPEKLGRIISRITALAGEPTKSTPVSIRWDLFGEHLNVVIGHLYEPFTQIQRFDVTVTQFAILNQITAVATYEAMDHENEKLFVYNNIDDPIRELKRMMKYAKKGYRIADRAIQELMVAIQDDSRPDYSQVWKGYEE